MELAFVAVATMAAGALVGFVACWAANKLTGGKRTKQAGKMGVMDKILVLEEGRQVGLGTHRSLLDTCPTYREIWASQAPEEEGEDGTR